MAEAKRQKTKKAKFNKIQFTPENYCRLLLPTPLFTRQKWVDSTHFISFHFSGDKRKAMFCQLWSLGWHMFWAQPGHLPILILNGQNIAIPSFVPAPVVGGEFSCPGGAAASATIHQLRITHDAAMRNSHYLIQENWYIEQRNQIFHHWSFYVCLTLTYPV